MNKTDVLGMGIRNLWRRKLRTFLTILSVTIGATSIVVMLSLGIGIKKGQEEMYKGIGDMTNIQVHSNYYEFDSQRGGQDQKKLNDRLVEEIKKIAHVKSVIPILRIEATVRNKKLVYMNGLMGIKPSDMESLQVNMVEGEMFHPGKKIEGLISAQALEHGFEDLKQRGPDSMEGNMVSITDRYTIDFESPWEEGFNPFDEVEGKKKSKKYDLRLTGVIEGGPYPFHIIIPMDQAKTLKLERDKFEAQQNPEFQKRKQSKEVLYSEFIVKADDLKNIQPIVDKLQEMGLQAYSDASYLEELEKQGNIIQAVLGGIGAIALLVAAIGIANTMIMSTYERTKEIGVMKVIGATIADIRNLFLVEAAFIGFLGGLFGIILSYLISFLLNHYLAGAFGAEMISVIPVWLVLSAILFSGLIGILSGYLPARRATKLLAIEAIRTD